MDALRNQAGTTRAAQLVKAGQYREKEWPFPFIPEFESCGPEQSGSPVVNPDFVLERNDYRVQIANEESPLHASASNLVANLYGSRGLLTDALTPTDIQPAQTTLAVSSGHQVFGTLTFGVDTDWGGLLADSLYRREVDAIRNRGGRLCEVTRLAMEPQMSSPEALATIFHVTFILASEVHTCTDLLVEIHPRHASFYQRSMGYRVVGPERTCARVGAPAVLMHLCLDFARNQIHQLAGAQNGRSLYRLFLPPAEQQILLQKLTTTDLGDA